jgi:2-C-methyl-D-erythritol 2,4-cyclodiphosphate synthase
MNGSYRVGHGYDAHRLVEGRPLILGGVSIPFEKGLLGHSDADVAAHAVIDALLGACALGDIGAHFPDSDEAYRGIYSIELLVRAGEAVRQAGYEIGNLDVTIIAQRPKLAPYIAAMRQKIAAALSIDEGDVSVKATTTERMGFEGEGLGISAHCVCLVTHL